MATIRTVMVDSAARDFARIGRDAIPDYGKAFADMPDLGIMRDFGTAVADMPAFRDLLIARQEASSLAEASWKLVLENDADAVELTAGLSDLVGDSEAPNSAEEHLAIMLMRDLAGLILAARQGLPPERLKETACWAVMIVTTVCFLYGKTYENRVVEFFGDLLFAWPAFVIALLLANKKH